MAIPETIIRFLQDNEIDYSVVQHPLTTTSWQTVAATHVPPAEFAKAVLLDTGQGYLLAVISVLRKLDLRALENQIGVRTELVPEAELSKAFPDCAKGAIPALGPAYGIDCVVDTTLKGKPEVYFEAGDHEEVIRMNGPDFDAVMKDARYGAIAPLDDS